MPDGGSKARIETLGKAEPPEVEASYIIELFHEILQLTSDVTQSDLFYWSKMSGIDLLPWEHNIISRMISAFNYQKSISRSKDCQSPLLSEQEVLQKKMSAYKEKMLGHGKG